MKKTLDEVVERNTTYHVLKQAIINYQHPVAANEYQDLQVTCKQGISGTRHSIHTLQVHMVDEQIIRTHYPLDQAGILAADYAQRVLEKPAPPST